MTAITPNPVAAVLSVLATAYRNNMVSYACVPKECRPPRFVVEFGTGAEVRAFEAAVHHLADMNADLPGAWASNRLLAAAIDAETTLSKLVAAGLVDIAATDDVTARAVADRLTELQQAIKAATSVPPAPEHKEALRHV